MNKFRSRKFLLTLLALISAILALFIGKLESGDFATIVSVIMTAYSFANAAMVFNVKSNQTISD